VSDPLDVHPSSSAPGELPEALDVIDAIGLQLIAVAVSQNSTG
jgi:hypothetical protein